jgi:2-polyprenyl-6-methoxyphenol hydroxylase-like FAD-dependent oxidoreductase
LIYDVVIAGAGPVGLYLACELRLSDLTGYSVEVEMADPDKLRLSRHYTPTGMYTYSSPGTIAMVEFDGGAFHRTQLITLDHVQGVLRRVSGAGVTVTALRLATTWTDRAYQATAYRKGRVLLAGDSAHIHSPLGGQGLNLGLGDAMNLGWKLAATIRGDAPAGLIDSYSVNAIRWERRFSTGRARKSHSCGRAGVRARSKPSSEISSTRATARPISPSACGVFLSATILAKAIRSWGAAPPTSSFPTGRGSASSSGTGQACCWTLTLPRRFKRSHTAGGIGSRMSQATRKIGWA